VKYLVRCGVDIFAKNAAGKTPREEVELVTSIKGAQSGGCGESDLDPDYYKTLSFLTEQEEKIEEFREASLNTSESRKEIIDVRIQSNNTSSDESEFTEDEEAENEDVVKFLTGNSSSSINGSKKSPKDRANCSTSSGSYVEVKKVFQNLGLSPTKFLENSPVKQGKEIDKTIKLKSYTRPEVATEDIYHNHESRDTPLSKLRLTYGMEIGDRNVKDDLISPTKPSFNKSSKTIAKSTDNVNSNTKEESYDNTRKYQSTPEKKNSNSSSHVKFSGINRIRISTNNIPKTKDISTLISASSRKMDKPVATASTGSSSSSSNPNASVGEKRPLSSTGTAPQDHHIDDNDEESKRKKQKISSTSSASSSSGSLSGTLAKEEVNPGKDALHSSNSGSTSSTGGTGITGSTSGKGGRSTRGSSSEKNTGKTSTGKGRGGLLSSSDKGDRKSPLSSSGSTSATNSPKKNQSRDHSDNENEDSDNSCKLSSKSSTVGNTSEVPSSVSVGGGLKVPPLKIVLSSTGTGNNTSGSGGGTVDGASSNLNRGNGNNGNNASSSIVSSNPSSGIAAGSSISALATPDQDQNKKAFVGIRASNKDDGTNTNTKSVSDIESSETGITGVENPDRTGSSSGASTPGDKEGEKSGSKRVTRSKGQGGSESGNSSSDTNTSGSMSASLTIQGGGDQTGRTSSNIVSASLTSTSHTASGSNQAIEGVNTVRISTVVSTSTTGISSSRDPVASYTTGAITMSTSSAATVMPSTSLTSSAGDFVHSTKPDPATNIATGTISSNISAGTTGTATTSSLSSCTGSATAANSSSYADYRQIKRKLRSQVDDAVTPSVGSNGQQAQGNVAQSTFSMGSGHGSGGASKNNGGNGSATNGRSGSSSFPSSSVAGPSGMVSTSTGIISSTGSTTEPMNDIEKYLNIRKQVEQRRKNLFPVQPKPPQGFKDYLMNRKTYLLQENATERLRCIQKILPPPSLGAGPLRELFKEQEQERYELRMKHVVEKEKLVLAVEQEILRVHGRAARALANQSLPFSVCTILRDEEIYTPIDPEQEEKNRDIRSRYNGRLFLSWLQDVDDKWEKIKEQMVLRHHNEAESLNAVQKMDWEWKVNELQAKTTSGSQKSTGKHDPSYQIDDLHIPMVHVSDDFDLANC